MTLKLGTHFLYPTLMRFEIIPIDDEWVIDGLQKKVTQSLIDDAYFYFDDFIQDWTGNNIPVSYTHLTLPTILLV